MFFNELLGRENYQSKLNQEKAIRMIKRGVWAVALLTWLVGTPASGAELRESQPLDGYVTPYNEHPRRATIEQRLAWGQIDENCAQHAHVALKMDYVGEWVTLEDSNGQKFGPYCVFDVLDPAHYDEVGAYYLGDVSRELWSQLSSHQDLSIHFSNPSLNQMNKRFLDSTDSNLQINYSTSDKKTIGDNLIPMEPITQQEFNHAKADFISNDLQLLPKQTEPVNTHQAQAALESQVVAETCQLMPNLDTPNNNDFILKCESE